ncbi:lytic murein transglycosylase [Desulforhopalus singaporensis]|uniref:Membrane-bound lytic murein transglycosylase B n=1 Tax=Desulforhopalus singaporensis TaxID=91360 RepID=A0A1H0KRH7_9BACT|nr:lytic murein transglycosylase [Desulforhopalus singaporensis]SDO58594.1 membrane-bound lytic murein transglycosylase B [Desulforhopalus singaporensis]
MFCRRWKLSIILATFMVMAGFSVHADGDFARWIEDFYPKAKEAGIESEVFWKAFEPVSSPDVTVLEKAGYQPEFKTRIWDYVDGRVNSLSIEQGQRMSRYHRNTLDLVEKQFGVSRFILLAIWSVESNYGAVLDRPERLHYVPAALATLAYGDVRRRKFAETQLIAALKIFQHKDVGVDGFYGSWAGAMGHTQFIPTSYLAYGVDMDKDGRRDVWNSVPDALATAANLLKENGWRTGKTWGYEVVLPNLPEAALQQYEGQTRLLSEWQQLGFVRPGGKRFVRSGEKAVLKMVAGTEGPGFLMMRNFFVLKRYNNADAYALAVGLLGDRIAGVGELVQPWPRPPGSLTFEQQLTLQRALQKGGWYSGKIDGYIGDASRAAIREFQLRNGMAPTGIASEKLLESLLDRLPE